MALSAFADKSLPPDHRSLADTLGRTSGLWDALVASLQSEIGPLEAECTYSGKAYGWSMRLKHRQRAIVYMTPCRSSFIASFALGEKACRAAAGAGLPASVLEIIDAAPRYAEGRGVRIPVRNRKDAEAIRTLAGIKLAH